MSDTSHRVILTGFEVSFLQLADFFFKVALVALPTLLVVAAALAGLDAVSGLLANSLLH